MAAEDVFSAMVVEDVFSAPKWLNRSFLQTALREGLRRGSLDINAYSIKPATKPGDNYLSQMFRASANVFSRRKSAEDMSFVIKSMPKGEKTLEFCNEAQYFAREIKMLTETLPLLNKILSEIQEPKLCADLLYLENNPEEILFLEDLCQAGFKSVDRLEYLDLKHTVLVAERLAAFHAASVVALQRDPDLENAYFTCYWTREQDANCSKFLKEGIASTCECLKVWQIFPEALEKFEKMDPARLLEKLYASTERKQGELTVLNHGDPWTSNFMFKYTDQKLADMRFVDFQLSCINTPVFDLLYFTMTSMKLDIRAENLDDVLLAYHKKFAEICDKLNTPLKMSFNELRESFYERLFFGFFIFIALVPFMTVPSEKARDLNDYLGDNSGSNIDMYLNEYYKRSLKVMLPFFMKHGLLD